MAQRTETGETVTQISADLHIGQTRLYQLQKAYERGESLEDKKKSGRKRKATPQIVSRIVWSLRDDPSKSSKQLKTEVNMGLGANERISDRTVRRIALLQGLPSRRPAFKIPLTPQQMAKRLDFAKRHESRDMRFWGHVIFSDETLIELTPQDRRQRVRRPLNKRFYPKYLACRPKEKGLAIMFWGCICLKGQGRLFRINGALNGEGYARILGDCIPDIIEKHNIRYPVFQEDNAPIHRSNIANRRKEELGLELLEWPPYSPDLSPIEGIWSYLKDRIRRRAVRRVQDLERIALEEWTKIPLTIIQSFIASMPDRLQAVKSARGGYTKY